MYKLTLFLTLYRSGCFPVALVRAAGCVRSLCRVTARCVYYVVPYMFTQPDSGVVLGARDPRAPCHDYTRQEKHLKQRQEKSR